MADQVIICPYCHKEIPLTEAISHRIREELRKEFEAEAGRRQEELARKEEMLLKKEKQIHEEVLRQVGLERARIEEEAKKKAEEKILLDMKDLKEQLSYCHHRLAERGEQLRFDRRGLGRRISPCCLSLHGLENEPHSGGSREKGRTGKTGEDGGSLRLSFRPGIQPESGGGGQSLSFHEARSGEREGRYEQDLGEEGEGDRASDHQHQPALRRYARDHRFLPPRNQEPRIQKLNRTHRTPNVEFFERLER